MKVRSSLKSLKGRHRDCKLVRRKGVVYVINKTDPRFKAKQAEPRLALYMIESVMEGRPRAVLFDIGNVLVRWDPRTLYSKIFADPDERDRFLAEVCTLPWHMQHDAGVSWDETVPALIAQHPHYAEAITAWRDRWWEMFSGAIPETEAAIEALHARGVPLHGLTNMAIETYPLTMAMSPATKRFRDVIVSGHEKVMKPERRIFEIVCERSGLAPQDFLFVDDSLTNIEAARAMGFHTHHFTDPAALKPALERCGLL